MLEREDGARLKEMIRTGETLYPWSTLGCGCEAGYIGCGGHDIPLDNWMVEAWGSMPARMPR